MQTLALVAYPRNAYLFTANNNRWFETICLNQICFAINCFLFYILKRKLWNWIIYGRHRERKNRWKILELSTTKNGLMKFKIKFKMCQLNVKYLWGCQAVHHSMNFHEMLFSATHFFSLFVWFGCNQFRIYRCSVKILAVHGWTRMALNKSKVIIHATVKNWILGKPSELFVSALIYSALVFCFNFSTECVRCTRRTITWFGAGLCRSRELF